MKLEGFTYDKTKVKVTEGSARLSYSNKNSGENELHLDNNTDDHYFQLEGEDAYIYELDKTTTPTIKSNIEKRVVNIELMLPSVEYSDNMVIPEKYIAYRFLPDADTHSGIVSGSQDKRIRGYKYTFNYAGVPQSSSAEELMYSEERIKLLDFDKDLLVHVNTALENHTDDNLNNYLHCNVSRYDDTITELNKGDAVNDILSEWCPMHDSGTLIIKQSDISKTTDDDGNIIFTNSSNKIEHSIIRSAQLDKDTQSDRKFYQGDIATIFTAPGSKIKILYKPQNLSNNPLLTVNGINVWDSSKMKVVPTAARIKYNDEIGSDISNIMEPGPTAGEVYLYDWIRKSIGARVVDSKNSVENTDYIKLIYNSYINGYRNIIRTIKLSLRSGLKDCITLNDSGISVDLTKNVTTRNNKLQWIKLNAWSNIVTVKDIMMWVNEYKGLSFYQYHKYCGYNKYYNNSNEIEDTVISSKNNLTRLTCYGKKFDSIIYTPIIPEGLVISMKGYAETIENELHDYIGDSPDSDLGDLRFKAKVSIPNDISVTETLVTPIIENAYLTRDPSINYTIGKIFGKTKITPRICEVLLIPNDKVFDNNNEIDYRVEISNLVNGDDITIDKSKLKLYTTSSAARSQTPFWMPHNIDDILVGERASLYIPQISVANRNVSISKRNTEINVKTVYVDVSTQVYPDFSIPRVKVDYNITNPAPNDVVKIYSNKMKISLRDSDTPITMKDLKKIAERCSIKGISEFDDYYITINGQKLYDGDRIVVHTKESGVYTGSNYNITNETSTAILRINHNN